MPLIHLVIDGKTVLNQHVSPTQTAPPADIVKYLTPGAQQQPGVLELLGIFGRAVKANHPLKAALTTTDSGYTIDVTLNTPPGAAYLREDA